MFASEVQGMDVKERVWRGEIRDRIRQEISGEERLTEEEIHNLVEREVYHQSLERGMTIEQRVQEVKEIYNSLKKLDVLQELLEDEDVTEIMVNGSKHIFYEKNGTLYEWNKSFYSEEELADVIQQIVGQNNRRVNAAEPIVDTRLKDGSRVNIVLNPIAIDGSCISIRKFPKEPMNMKRLIAVGALPQWLAEYLGILVKSGYNIFVSGGTGSGKTTFLNALSEYIPREDRLITIEDSAELQIRNIPNMVRLETRMGNESTNDVTARDLIRSALRMRPTRVLVGECRGAEALDMLQAMNTGHDGSLSTGHANSARDMLMRLETMVCMAVELPITAIRGQIASGIDIIVHLGRLRDKSRKVLEIVELDGIEDGDIQTRCLYEFCETGEKKGLIQGEWVYRNSLFHREKLLAAGQGEMLDDLVQKRK